MALASPGTLYEFETFTIHAEFYALASRVWCCISPKPSLYCHAEFYIHWLVLYGVAVLYGIAVLYGVALYESKTCMHGFARALCVSKTFTIHAEFYALASPVWFC